MNHPIEPFVTAIRQLLAAVALVLLPGVALAQQPLHIPAELVVAPPAQPGGEARAALAFAPDPGWHGYWKNPGDAGFGMTLDWSLPDGWSAGEPDYPVPETLVISGLMNHVYNGAYAVIVPLSVKDWRAGQSIAVEANYLACTDEICVPQRAVLRATLPPRDAMPDPRFADWLAAIPPPLDRDASYESTPDLIRLAIPLPAAMEPADPHLFLANEGWSYAAPQLFYRSGDTLVVELQRDGTLPEGGFDGLFSFGDHGFAFVAMPGAVPSEGLRSLAAPPALLPLALAALVGGVLLNVLPCVFPILSLKALHLARGGADERAARRDAASYTAGVLAATIGLGALLLALRAGGAQVGWAFQLQQPGVVFALLVLALAITANLAGLFALPALSFGSDGRGFGSFATGLLAAFVATPCTGPFMAAALGAALVLPPAHALLLFAMLGLGLALPFLAIGFVPALRRRLPRPGPWMERFRRWMALPMGLTALALAWLAERLGGWPLALAGMLAAAIVVAMLRGIGRRRAAGRPALGGMVAAGLAAVLALAIAAPHYGEPAAAGKGVLAAQRFDTATLARAKAAGRPVFLWFTADWCVTCKVNESVAIEREATAEAFAAAGVVTLRGDWTRPDPAITAFLESRGAAGVPLYVWIDPDGTERVLPQVLSPDSLVDLARAAEPPDTPR